MIEVRRLRKRHGDTAGRPDVSHVIHRGDAVVVAGHRDAPSAARFSGWE